MQTILPLFVLAILVSCLLIASWPLLLRPAFAGLTGTGCIAGGASLIALLVSGVLPIPASTVGHCPGGSKHSRESNETCCFA